MGTETETDIAIEGEEYIHPYALKMLEELLNSEENDIRMIRFLPESEELENMGEYHHPTRTVMLHLPCLVNKTISELKSTNPQMSFVAGLWMNLIYTIHHEFHHSVACHTDYKQAVANKDTMETEAIRWATEQVAEMAAEGELTPPSLDEMPYFAEKIMNHIVDIEKLKEGDGGISDGEYQWAQTQLSLAEKGLLFTEDSGIESFSAWFETTKDTSETEDKDVVPVSVGEEVAGEPVAEEEKTEVSIAESPAPQPFVMAEEHPQVPQASVSATAVKTDEKTTEEVIPIDDFEAMEALEMAEHAPMIEGEWQDSGDHPYMSTPTVPTPVAEPAPAPQPEVAPVEVPVAGAVPKPQPVEAPPGMSVSSMCREVWMGLYEHVFNACQFQGVRFALPGAVIENPFVIPRAEARALFTHCRTHVGNGRYEWVEVKDGVVYGTLYKNNTLPAYEIRLKIGENVIDMKLIPQNPAKPSRYGEMARNGSKIAWLIEDRVNGTITNLWRRRIIDNRYEATG